MNVKPSFCFYAYDGGFWLRVFGKGLLFVDREKHPPLFSERIGKTKTLRFGKWSISSTSVDVPQLRSSIRSAVLAEIQRQQRPGGALNK